MSRKSDALACGSGLNYISSIAILMGFLLVVQSASGQDALPEALLNDPVTELLGPEVMAAAINEGSLTIYGSTSTESFLNNGGREAFEERFGIEIFMVSGRLRGMTDRVRTEVAVNNVIADILQTNDQYMIELQSFDALEQWKPPAPELDRIDADAFVQEPAGYWWPVQISAQALIINTQMVNPEDITSYWDIIDPEFAGKVGVRDPRSADGGAWHFLNMYIQDGLGIDYINQLVEVTEPFIVEGGSRALRDAVLRGEFAIGFSGRGEFLRDLPPGVPLAFVVPEEGLAWTPASIAMIKGGPNPNAAKVFLTWFYELPQLQLWADNSRPVPHPDIGVPIPEMSVSTYPLMQRIPDEHLANPNPFFEEMERVFGIR